MYNITNQWTKGQGGACHFHPLIHVKIHGIEFLEGTFGEKDKSGKKSIPDLFDDKKPGCRNLADDGKVTTPPRNKIHTNTTKYTQKQLLSINTFGFY